MNSRITAILIGLLSVTGVFATTVIEQNDSITNEIVSDSITNEIVSDSITMAMPSDSITIQVTDTDSIARQQEADKNLLSLLETDSTEQILPVIKMLRMLEYADIKWEFYHNMVWSCRLFYFTNYDHVQGDMENTFDFILNRFFSTRLFVHLRYDDARALNKDFGHFQLKELLSFGFNYKF